MSTPEVVELKQDIEQHRAELAGTVDQLAAKLDVKAKVKPYAIPAAAGVLGVTAAVVVVKKRRS